MAKVVNKDIITKVVNSHAENTFCINKNAIANTANNHDENIFCGEFCQPSVNVIGADAFIGTFEQLAIEDIRSDELDMELDIELYFPPSISIVLNI